MQSNIHEPVQDFDPRSCQTYSHREHTTRLHRSIKSSKASLFIELPEELVEKVVLYATDNFRPSRMYDLLQVCKNWYRQVLPLLWTNINVDECSLYRLGSLSQSSPNFGLVKHLTISPNAQRIRVCYYCHDEDEDDWHVNSSGVPCLWIGYLRLGMQKLQSKLSLMHHLQTFSLNFGSAPVKYNHSENWRGPFVMQSLLQAMPESLENLELNTQAYHRCDDQENILCSCEYIGDLLPRLKHLKLGLGRICSRMLRQSSTIETIAISLTDGKQCTALSCDTSYHQCIHSVGPSEAHTRGARLRMSIIHTGLQLIKSASFPRLQCFKIVDISLGDPFWKTTYLRHDLLRQVTTSFPVMEYSDLRELTIPPIMVLRVESGNLKAIVDLRGTVSDVTSYLSDSNWIEDAQGLRVPALIPTNGSMEVRSWKRPIMPDYGIRWPAYRYSTPVPHELELRFDRTLFQPQSGALGEVKHCSDLRSDELEIITRSRRDQLDFWIEFQRRGDDTENIGIQPEPETLIMWERWARTVLKDCSDPALFPDNMSFREIMLGLHRRNR